MKGGSNFVSADQSKAMLQGNYLEVKFKIIGLGYFFPLPLLFLSQIHLCPALGIVYRLRLWMEFGMEKERKCP